MTNQPIPKFATNFEELEALLSAHNDGRMKSSDFIQTIANSLEKDSSGDFFIMGDLDDRAKAIRALGKLPDGAALESIANVVSRKGEAPAIIGLALTIISEKDPSLLFRPKIQDVFQGLLDRSDKLSEELRDHLLKLKHKMIRL